MMRSNLNKKKILSRFRVSGRELKVWLIAAACFVLVGSLVGLIFVSNAFNTNTVSSHLNRAYRESRPSEGRISDLEFAPRVEGKRGGGDAVALDFLAAKSKALDAVSQVPGASSYFDLGRVFLCEGEFDKSIEQLQAAAALEPARAAIRNDLALAFLGKAQTTESEMLVFLGKANEEISGAIELDPDLVEAKFNKAIILELLRLPNQAKDAWKNYRESDGKSKWSQEAGERITKLEGAMIPDSDDKTVKFIELSDRSNDQASLNLLTDSRETVRYSSIPQKLRRSYIEQMLKGERVNAERTLRALRYAARLEKEMLDDVFWTEAVSIYDTVDERKLALIDSADDLIRKAFDTYLAGEYSEAALGFRAAKKRMIEANNPPEARFLDYWIANSLFYANRVQESKSILEDVIAFSENRNYRWLLGLSLYRQSITEGASGNSSKAIKLAERAMKIAQDSEDTHLIRSSTTQVASAYRSVANVEKALSVLAGLHVVRPDRLSWSDVWNLTETFAAAGMLNTAESFSREASAKASSGSSRDAEVVSLLNVAGILAARNKLNDAEQLILSAVRIADTLPDSGAQTKTLAYANLRLGQVKTEKSEVTGCFEAFDAALKASPESEFTFDQYEILKGRMVCSLKLGETESVNQQLPAILEMYDRHRVQIKEEQNRNFFFDRNHDIYETAIDFRVSQGDLVGALNYSERSRSRATLDLMMSRSLADQTANENLSSLPEDKLRPLGFEEFRHQIPNGLQFLVYNVLPRKTLIWVVTSGGIEGTSVSISADELNALVAQFRGSISSGNAIDPDPLLAAKLYETLIRPIKQHLDPTNEISIVPDKSLGLLPFAAIGAEKTFAEEFILSMSPSINVSVRVSMDSKTERPARDESVLAIGDPAFAVDQFQKGLQRLPASADESKEVAAVYRNGRVLTSSQATKENVLKYIRGFEVFHFAGHFVINERESEPAGLVLAGSDRESAFLGNHEILRLKLPKTKLVVLSACDTGVGKYFNGEGVLAGSSAFLVAGAKNVVVSQWRVDSEATRELMVLFHQFRKSQNMSVAKALQSAQMQLRASQKYKHPYYWAAFVSVGGNSGV